MNKKTKSKLIKASKNLKPPSNKEIINQLWDEFLGEYYLQKCAGCPEGHSSFWRTVTQSKEWDFWKRFNKCTNWDFAECEDLGIISERHWKEFMKFIKNEKKDR